MFPDEPHPDQHTIETPEQMSLDLPMAGIGSRFLAMAVDTLIQIGIGLVALIAVGFLGFAGALSGIQQPSVWLVAGLVIVFFLLMYGYFAFFEIIWNGQTPGKRVAGIRVVKESGRPLTAAETIGRNLLRIVDELPAFYAVGVLVALLNSKNKRIGDFIAGSIVVREASLSELKPVWQTPDVAAAQSRPPLGGAMLSIEDLSLIDTFLNRRHSLTPDVRSQMALQILHRLKPKLLLPGDDNSSAESILESLAYERRSTGNS
uniref:RDD domain-containing protein n=1 Tax=uncultured bacterium CSLG10 TaxID=1091576 RepID=G4WV56_9BACT|nr:RDD domain-containing protein [uncultured bacterium CSLG10]